jgi:hypothetical protein
MGRAAGFEPELVKLGALPFFISVSKISEHIDLEYWDVAKYLKWKFEKIEKGKFFTVFLGDVVAQLAKATGRHQTEDAAVPGSNPAPPQSPERGQDTWLCIIQKQKSQQVRRHCSSKKTKMEI